MLIAIIKIGTFFLNIIYFFIKLCPTQQKVVMISRQSNTPSDDFLMLKEEIEKRYPDTEVFVLCHTLDGGLKSTIFTKFCYGFHMFKQMYHIATSKVVILDTYCIVVSLLKHKKDLKVMQIWHSMGTMKKFGYTTVDTAEGTRKDIADAMRMHKNYDYILCSGEAYRDHLAAGFACNPNKIVIRPLPRLDRLVNDPEYAESIKCRIYEAYPVLKEKPVVLYCPTFRKDERDFAEAAAKLTAAIDPEQFNLVFKLHPLSKVVPDAHVLAPKEFSSQEMIFVADYMISDYSCIVYEAAVRNIPLFFYDYDIDFYADGRGLAIDYFHELPGVTSPDATVIGKAIMEDACHNSYDRKELRRFADKYVHPTAHATADIVDLLEPVLNH